MSAVGWLSCPISCLGPMFPIVFPCSVLVVCGSLTADAFIGNVQESVFAQGASQLEALTYPSLFSAILGLVFVLINDDPFVTWRWACSHCVCRVPLVLTRFATSDTVNSPAAMVSMALTGLVNSTGLYFVLKVCRVWLWLCCPGRPACCVVR